MPFGTATQRALWRYQHHYRPEPLGPDVYFFLTLDGRPMERSALTQAIGCDSLKRPLTFFKRAQ